MVNYYENNKILKAILDNNKDLVLFALDREYRYIFYTQAHKDTIKAIWGCDIYIGLNMLDIIKLEDDRNKAKINFDKALRGEKFTLIEEYGDNNLTRTFYRDYYSPLIVDNEIIGLYVFIVDVTDIKKAEQEINRYKYFYHSILDNITNPIFYKNKNGTYEFVNIAFCNTFHTTPEQIIGKTIQEILPDKSDYFFQKDNELINSKTRQTYELELEVNDEKKIFIINKTLLFENNDIIGITGSFTDITYLKNIEKKLKENETYLTKLLDILPVGIFIVDISFNIKLTNNFSNKILEQLLIDNNFKTTNLADIKFIDNDRNIVDFPNSINSMLDKANKFENLILGIFRKGIINWYSVNAIKEENEILFTFNDITELITTREILEKNISKLNKQNKEINDYMLEQERLLEELLFSKKKLEESLIEKNKLFSIIAHDLKSPLSGIIGINSILVDDFDELSDDKKFELVNKIYNSNKNLLRLINNLMDWVNLKNNNVTIKKEKINIQNFIKEIQTKINNNLQLKEITLNVNLEENYFVLADRIMLTSVLNNLLYNAIKFSYRGSKIDLNISRTENNYILFEVKDYGIGIPEIMLNKIFDITEKTGRPGTEDEKSTGLGLIIVKDFVEKNNGKIWIESKEKTGTSVFFTIPEVI